MTAFIQYIIIIFAVVFIVAFFSEWIQSKSSNWRNIFAFIVEFGSAFSTGFSLDIIRLFVFNEIPYQNIIAPLGMWSFFSIIGHIYARKTATNKLALFVPYVLNALIAIFASFLHGYNLFIGIPLLIISFLILAVKTPGQKNNKKITKIMIIAAGDYYLNQPVKEAIDLTELSDEEYKAFELGGYTKIFKDEKIYNGKEVILNGSSWDTMIGVTEGKIYKIALQIMDADKNKVADIFQSTLDYMFIRMGKSTEHKPFSKRYFWDAYEGNIMYEYLNKFGVHCINLYITSSSIKNQMKEYVLKQNEVFETNQI